jgi:hypothetical protein
MAKISKSSQSGNSSRNYTSDKQIWANTDPRKYWRWDQVPGRSKHPLPTSHTSREHTSIIAPWLWPSRFICIIVIQIWYCKTRHVKKRKPRTKHTWTASNVAWEENVCTVWIYSKPWNLTDKIDDVIRLPPNRENSRKIMLNLKVAHSASFENVYLVMF